MLFARLDAQQVSAFDTFVVPRFLSMFGTLAASMILPCDHAVVADLGCRTGFVDSELPRVLPQCRIYGFDTSETALEQARNKASLMKDIHAEYFAVYGLPLPTSAASFSHVLCIYPLVDLSGLRSLIAEAARLIAPQGQLILAVPLRGSFQEVACLLKEYATKHDDDAVSKALDTCHNSRPTIETLGEMLETCGFSDVDVEVQQVTIPFGFGANFFEDPVAQLMILPDFRAQLGSVNLDRPLSYVRAAIEQYWSDLPFELSVDVGCASARGV